MSRHWKERFDPHADFVFAKRFNLGLDRKNPWVEDGDPVPKDRRMKALNVRVDRRKEQVGRYLNVHRLRMWWDAGWIRLAEFDAPDVQSGSGPAPEKIIENSAPKGVADVEPLGAGWYKITLPDGKSCKVRGKAKAEAKLAELAG